jgi:hypothetical protein
MIIACAIIVALAVAGCSGPGPTSSIQQPPASRIDKGMDNTSRTSLDGMGSPTQVFGSDWRR